MIRVFYTRRCDACPILFPGDTPVDPPAYRLRLARMASAQARRQTRAGLYLLQHGLRAFGLEHDAIMRIGFAPGGRPEIVHAPAFSISHADDLVACALCDDGRIGVDLERRRTFNPSRTARLLSRSAQPLVERDPDRFFDIWCAQEATVKASGRVGLARMRAIRFDGDTAWLDDQPWSLAPLTLDHAYAGCLASDRALSPVEPTDLSDRFAGNTAP